MLINSTVQALPTLCLQTRSTLCRPCPELENPNYAVQALKAGETGDDDIIRLAAEDAELARAKERLTLKHRNSSKWARRALKRGMDVMDEGTKAAVAEQLRLGEELRRKVPLHPQQELGNMDTII